MYAAISRLWSGERGPAPPAACDLECCPADPGSVTPHDAHVLVRLPPPAGAPPAAGGWWPESVDGEPALAAVAAAVKAAGGGGAPGAKKVKVTAFEYLEGHAPPPQPGGGGAVDVLVFPGAERPGVRLAGVDAAAAPAAAVRALWGAAAGGGAAAAAAPHTGQPLEGVSLLVCCHAARDARCGALGPPLAARLADAAAARAAGGRGGPPIAVYLTSHVGGHKYAANVVVYGGACSGAWFGGLRAAAAAEFLGALGEVPPGGEPAAHPALRRWWRGAVGRSKEAQRACFAAAGGGGDIEDAAACGGRAGGGA